MPAYEGSRLRVTLPRLDADGSYVMEPREIAMALIPEKGATLFFDSMAIPADAAHPKNAHLFINYMLRADVAALRARAERDRVNDERFQLLVRQGAATALQRDEYRAAAIASTSGDRPPMYRSCQRVVANGSKMLAVW